MVEGRKPRSREVKFPTGITGSLIPPVVCGAESP
jgi:hypothetical protein